MSGPSSNQGAQPLFASGNAPKPASSFFTKQPTVSHALPISGTLHSTPNQHASQFNTNNNNNSAAQAFPSPFQSPVNPTLNAPNSTQNKVVTTPIGENRASMDVSSVVSSNASSQGVNVMGPPQQAQTPNTASNVNGPPKQKSKSKSNKKSSQGPNNSSHGSMSVSKVQQLVSTSFNQNQPQNQMGVNQQQQQHYQHQQLSQAQMQQQQQQYYQQFQSFQTPAQQGAASNSMAMTSSFAPATVSGLRTFISNLSYTRPNPNQYFL
jgi:hypothetical protein